MLLMSSSIGVFLRVLWYLTNKAIRGAAVGNSIAATPGAVVCGITLVIYSLIQYSLYREIIKQINKE